MKTKREFRLTDFDRHEDPLDRAVQEHHHRPRGRLRHRPEGEDRTRVTLHNVLESHGFGKLIMPLAMRGARKDADAFGKRIKAAVEAS